MDYDIDSRRITYLKRNAHDPKANPHKIGTPEYEQWTWDQKSGTFDAVWIDPSRSVVLSVDDSDRLKQGLKPESFRELLGQDPKVYFADDLNTLSAYLAPSLKEWLRGDKRD